MRHQLVLKNISKRYGQLQACDQVNLVIKPASIHALLGENGAGKSTLVNIIYGLVEKDSGQILFEDQEIVIDSPIKARQAGIGIVFQHFELFDVLTVMENILLGVDFKGSRQELAQHVMEISKNYHLEIDPNALISDLSTGEKQRVEIIRCLLQKPKLLILDEPTSVLTPVETNHLFDTLRKLRDEGCSILFIGHKLNEIKQICDEATVLRRGKNAGVCDLTHLEVAEIAEMMVGSKVSDYLDRSNAAGKEAVLSLKHPTKEEHPDEAFSVRELVLKSGCITGIAGISGHGQDPLMSYLAGETIGQNGEIIFLGQNIEQWGVKQRNAAGILFVPTERLGRSAVTQLSLLENALLGISKPKKFDIKGLINYRALAGFSDQVIDDFSVKTESHQSLASSLSGGNLQKYIVGRTILQSPKVLLISNPTWGVDIQSAIFIRNQIIAMRDAGVAILIVSEDLDETFTLCDELAVIKDGHVGEVQPIEQLTLEDVGLMMTA